MVVQLVARYCFARLKQGGFRCPAPDPLSLVEIREPSYGAPKATSI